MGREAKYVVKLDEAERDSLQRLVDEGKGSKEARRRARVVLKADEAPGAPAWTDERVAEFAEVGLSTVLRTRRNFVAGGGGGGPPAEAVPRAEVSQVGRRRRGPIDRHGVQPRARRSKPMDLEDAGGSARGIGGRHQHQPRMRARDAQKNLLKPHRKEQWVIPPERNAEFVAAMEDVLGIYQRPRDPRRPLVCLDEQSKQLIKETRAPRSASPGRVARHDYEYERNGTANLFMMFAPLEGWRRVKVTERRTRLDFAEVIRELVDVHFPDAEEIVLVMDNLNTHRPASLYEAFPPAEARRLVERLEIHYTPKHGSWLDMAETELSVLTKQCLDRRIPDVETLKGEVSAWMELRNTQQATIDWRFTADQARIRLKRLYPSVQV